MLTNGKVFFTIALLKKPRLGVVVVAAGEPGGDASCATPPVELIDFRNVLSHHIWQFSMLANSAWPGSCQQRALSLNTIGGPPGH